MLMLSKCARTSGSASTSGASGDLLSLACAVAGSTAPAVREVVDDHERPLPDRNLRGRLWRGYDQAGLASSERYDFKGNLIESARQLATSYREVIDWSALEAISDVAALAVHIMANTALTGATYDIDGGQQIV